MQSTQKKPLTAFTVISTIFLLLLTVLFIFPFYWILTGAFKSQPDTIMIPPQWFPKAPTMENFQQLMVQNPALQWMWNSVFISLVTMFLVCATSSLAGYVLAKKRFYGQRILFAIFIAAMALPKQVVLVPLVRIVNFMGIHDTLWWGNSYLLERSFPNRETWICSPCNLYLHQYLERLLHAVGNVDFS